MKSQFYKVVDDKGRVLIPHDLRKMAELQDNDIVRLCVYSKMVIMERVEIQPVDMVAKLRNSFIVKEKEMPDDAIECFIIAALSKMDRQKLGEIMTQLTELLASK